MTQIHGQISVSAVWDYATCRSVKKKIKKSWICRFKKCKKRNISKICCKSFTELNNLQSRKNQSLQKAQIDCIKKNKFKGAILKLFNTKAQPW